ncbi:DUF6414 family protein, partial [Balneola sp. EhC07]|uniref:DUF6414 family protein n=1 Tax=Balneola sp. EhC07 TaxID=1849360 RepID=UPI00128FD6B5
MKSIKDIIYLDIEKSKSLISQLKGGVINEISKVFEEENTLEGELGLDIKIVKIGGKEFDTERTIKTEKVELFHEMINEIESQLKEVDSLSDLNELYKEFENDIETFFKLLPNLNYIKATGWANFEDYERFKNIYTNFNEIQRLIFHSVIIDNPEIVEIRKQLNDAKKNAKTNTNRNAVSKELAKITSLEKRFDIQLESLTGISLQDEDYIERMKIFLDTFSPNRLNFRLL